MAEFIEVARTGALEDATMKAVNAAGDEILLARVGDSYYAADNLCSHMKDKLSQGHLEGTVVTCPRHGSQFDLRTGQVVRWLKGSGLASMLGKVLKPPRPLAIYNVKVEDDGIWIEI